MGSARTASEAGIRALIINSETHAKQAVESSHMIADIAVLDPELTFTVPPGITAATGLDAMPIASRPLPIGVPMT